MLTDRQSTRWMDETLHAHVAYAKAGATRIRQKFLT